MESKHRKGYSGVAILLAALGVIAVVLFVIGLIPRLNEQRELKKSYEETVGAIPVVQTVVARPGDNKESVVLPGNIGSIQYTTIYARVDGYLKSRLVDIGDHVKTGQLLAFIDTPTLDEQLAEAKSDLEKSRAQERSSEGQLSEAKAQAKAAHSEVDRSKANVAYTTVTAQRWENLYARGAVSEQSRDEKVRSRDASSAELDAKKASAEAADDQVKVAQSNVAAAKAAVMAQVANVKRVKAKQDFQRVVAPFDGVITARKVDPGALITQGSQSSNLELFQMGKLDRLRIYVSVPQRLARYLKAGQTAQLLVPEFPDRNFNAIVTNVSGALDPNTRTRQTEIQMDNPDHALLPGMYAEVRITGLHETPWLRVAGTCLVAKTDGQYVVIIKDGKAHFQKVQIGRDYGSEVEIKSGIEENDIVIVSPNDDLLEGSPVQPAKS